MKHEVDRVDFARYLFTGYIFEEDELSLTCGNRTMFCIPQSLNVSRTKDENFFFTFGFGRLANKLDYTESLKITIEKFMIERVERLKTMVTDGQLKMSFEQGYVSMDNQRLLRKIKSLNPYTVDWSNIPDYFSKEEFLAMAREVSGENTVHYMHSMNWTLQVHGAFIGDFPADQTKEIVKNDLKAWEKYHGSSMAAFPFYKSVWRDKTVFACLLNLTENMRSHQFKINFLEYLFGDIKHNFTNIEMADCISYNSHTIQGGFTFSKNVKLKKT